MTNGYMRLSDDRIDRIEQMANQVMSNSENCTLTELNLSGNIAALVNHIRYMESTRENTHIEPTPT